MSMADWRSLLILAKLRESLRLLHSQADRRAKTRLLLAVALIAGSAALLALAPVALKLIVDHFTGSGPTPSPTPWLGLIAAYVLCHYFARVFSELRILAYVQGEQRLYRLASRHLFAHLIALPLRFHVNRKCGALSQTLTSGLLGYQIILQHLIYTVLPVTIELLTITSILLSLDRLPYLAVLACASALYLTTFGFGAIRIAEPARAVSASQIDAHGMLTDALVNCETVKYFGAESIMASRYDESLRHAESNWVRFYARRTLNALIVATVFALALGGTLVMAGHEVRQGSMTLGDFVLVNTYILQVMRPLEMLGYALRDLAQGTAFLERMLEVFDETPEAPPTEAPSTRQAVRGELTFDRVSFSYGPGRPVLRDVSFSIGAGQTVAIIGVSGSGKSSLVRLLFRLYEPDAGQILLDGCPIASASLSSLRAAIAVVPQDTVLFNDTIGHNIALGRSGSSQKEIERAAKLAHLHDFVATLPDGYATVVGERGLKLSGGERQRIAIARAVLKRPHVFVFDEATSSLDSKTEREIMRKVIEVSKAHTTLIIAHRLSTVIHADEILVLHGGVIVERGRHHQLLPLGGHYAALWNAQNAARAARSSSVAG